MQELDPWIGKIPWGGHGNPLQYSCLENSHGQRSLVGSDSQTWLKRLSAAYQRTFELQTHVIVLAPWSPLSFHVYVRKEKNQNIMLKKNEKDTDKILSTKEKEWVSNNSKKEKRNVLIFVRIPSLVLIRQEPGGMFCFQCWGGRN